jgi:hypothetical protein
MAFIKGTNWSNFHSGNIPQPKKKPKSYSLIYPNGVVVIANVSWKLCDTLKKQHIHAVIKPNYES